MKCPKCRAGNRPDALFCRKCSLPFSDEYGLRWKELFIYFALICGVLYAGYLILRYIR